MQRCSRGCIWMTSRNRGSWILAAASAPPCAALRAACRTRAYWDSRACRGRWSTHVRSTTQPAAVSACASSRATTKTRFCQAAATTGSTRSRAVATRTARTRASLLAEAHRLLRPGGRACRCRRLSGKRPVRQRTAAAHLPQAVRVLGDRGVGQLDRFTARLEELGFTDITVEHLQLRVAPSVAHIPWVTLKFLLTDVVFGKAKMTRARWNNVLAPVLLPLVSVPLGPMTYCMITATKQRVRRKRTELERWHEADERDSRIQDDRTRVGPLAHSKEIGDRRDCPQSDYDSGKTSGTIKPVPDWFNCEFPKWHSDFRKKLVNRQKLHESL